MIVIGLQVTKVLVANLLGYTSIACWLCAQFPQVLKNISLQSCEGLALPFLVNWLFGDITNIIGCILTDQLPFQTYLAAYFCLVDLALVIQFFYYRSLSTPTETRKGSYTYSSPRQSIISHPSSPRISTLPDRNARSISHPPSLAVISSPAPRPRARRNMYSHYSNGSTSQLPSVSNAPDISIIPSSADGSYQAIYEAALDVARAAERASSRRSRSRRRKLSRHSGQLPNNTRDTNDGDGAGMLESFYSERSARTDSTENEDDDERFRTMSASTPALLDNRGRSLQRTAGQSGFRMESIDGLPPEGGKGFSDQTQEMREAVRSKSRSVSMVRGSGGRGKGRRAAGVAFMSLGLLVGWNGISGSTRVVTVFEGRVIAQPATSLLSSPTIWPPRYPILLDSVQTTSPVFIPHSNFTEPQHPPLEPPTFQRVVGRISAWTCTTLYLTSRLPQIWKNFTRKSVEGLSILLFIFAFCGNLTYVLSILLNPAGDADPAEAAHYLLEALPYLLGSGGTLIFDLTIMIQSLIYGSASPIQTPSQFTISRRKGPFSRRRLRHLEDGNASLNVSTERQPLISGSGMQYATRHERSVSVDASRRARGDGDIRESGG